MERRRSYLSEHNDLPAVVLVDEQGGGPSSLPDNRELEDASVELNRFVQVPNVEYDGMKVHVHLALLSGKRTLGTIVCTTSARTPFNRAPS
jgi:hypothetical protein